jgi:hypothetical protein
MKKILAAALLTAGCGTNFEYATTGASGLVEEKLLSETGRIATAATAKVRGEITENLAPNQAVMGQEAPVGWYLSGVAYYYRPQVAKHVTLEPAPYKETATNVSGHEVCHAVTGSPHDVKHWECMNRYAAPTYPYPGATGVWNGYAYASIRVGDMAPTERIQ